jgi:hypothetical protein
MRHLILALAILAGLGAAGVAVHVMTSPAAADPCNGC